MAVSFTYSSNYSPSAPVAEITIRAQSAVEVTALLDSGADGTMIPHHILLGVGAVFVRTAKVTGIGGKSSLVDLYLIEIQIGPLQVPGVKAVASRVSTEVIIGRDVLNHLIVTLDGIAGETVIS